MYAIGETVSYIIVLFNYRQHFYSGTKIIHHKVELLLHVCLVFAERKPLKCAMCRFLLNIYGRKTPKYKKAGLLTLYVGKLMKRLMNWNWWYSNAKSGFKNVCALENSEFSSEMSDHGLWILDFSVYYEVLSKSKICMILVKMCSRVVLFNYRQHIFLLSVLLRKLNFLCLFSFRKEETSQAYQFFKIR